MEPIVIDTETEKIGVRPDYPPRAVGVAIRWPGGDKKYYAFGHPEGNNCTVDTAMDAVCSAYRAPGPVVFHNSSFDIDVLEGMTRKRPERFEDTLYLAFLNDPYEPDLALKPLTEKHLKMPPREQEDLRDWILDNIKGAKRAKTKWGEHISEAPGNIVAPYAISDIDRTYRLWKKLRPVVLSRGMRGAYRRELDLTYISMEMERSGIRVDLPRLREALGAFEKLSAIVQKAIFKKLKVKGDFKLSQRKQLSERMNELGYFNAIIKTKSGKGISTRVNDLRMTCNDPELVNLLSVDSVIQKYTSSFLRPWIAQAERTGGRIQPRFNQCRGRSEDGGGGARSGRFSSSDPNLQNVAANPEDSANKETLFMLQRWLKRFCNYEFFGLRDYFIPDEGCVMICCDYNQQELRILAHFEQDRLMNAYLENPDLDIHTFCQGLIHERTGILYERKSIKTTVFGIVYGMGAEKLAIRLGIKTQEARRLRKAIYEVIPGIRNIQKELQWLANHNEPLRTWGGREYFCEEPRFVERLKQWISFEYKMLNYLIQPSAADCTKAGMLNVREQVPKARIAVQVHDELVCMAPDASYGPKIVRAMSDVRFRVPMTATCKISTTSWARAKELH